jgi:hypothetical protein
MILFSTPSSITWLAKNQKTIKFFGEWTLEPKFYLDAEYALEIDELKESKPLSLKQIKDYLPDFLQDCLDKNWVVKIESV